MAANADPLQMLAAALNVPADSDEQATLLAVLRESLEAHPNPIPILCSTLVRTVSGAADSLLKRWVLDLLHFGICRSSLALDMRTNLATTSVQTLATMLNDPVPKTVKLVVSILTGVYSLIFRQMFTIRSQRQEWDVVLQCKARILEFVWSLTAPSGVKLAAVKFMQRVILLQTRGNPDPRLQNRDDPNISSIPTDHPILSSQALEQEANKLLEGLVTLLYTSSNPDILSAILNSWSNLIKLRPHYVQLVVSSLGSWTPSALSGLSASAIKSVEKGVRILLVHISRGPHGSAFGAQISEALSVQSTRMERASAEEKARKAAASATTTDAAKKRPHSASAEAPSDVKRVRMEVGPPASNSNSAAFLAGFDFNTLPIALIIEIIVANLAVFSEPALSELVNTYRQSQGTPTAPTATTPVPVAPPTAPRAHDKGKALEATPPPVKEEPIDPLKMDIDEEEIEYEPDKLNQELGIAAADEDVEVEETAEADISLTLEDFRLPSPTDLPEDERIALMRKSMTRISDSADELKTGLDDSSAKTETSAIDMWMLLVIRMFSRVSHPRSESSGSDDEDAGKRPEDEDVITADYSRQDKIRQSLCDYIMEDFAGRLRLATFWMNEEWYNDRINRNGDLNRPPNYDSWLNQIVSTYQTILDTKADGKPDSKDKAFARFLLDLPAVPPDVFDLLRDLSVETDKMHVGFTSLREFVVERPSLRSEALQVLLELTTHSEPVTRRAAINTVKRWIPGNDFIEGKVRGFALRILRRLQKPPAKDDHKDGETHANGASEDQSMEDGQLATDDIEQTPYLPEEMELPAQKVHVLQHVELLFALSVKVPEFLDEIFEAYGHMDSSTQEVIQDLITPLMKSLGSSNGKLLTLMRTCPAGSESLALRVLTIFTESGRPSAQLVALVKGLISERDLDARFLIPIIAEMDKSDILRYLPRIVSILNGQAEPKNLVRSVFNSVVTTPPQTFGSVTSNLPRVRQSELLTPAELMVLLHESEKEIGLKAAMEAIGICFSMTDVFRSEILAVVMQQIVDEPVLPVLFLRTVIKAVTTYKSLVGFVSTTLLSRLITKKIWQNPHLWEGFIRCAKAIAPASFGALLQLPKEQLRELVDKQPSLKSGLRDYVAKKAGNKARVAGFLDIFGEDDGAQNQTQDTAMVAAPA